jgi:hypothetical protein
VAAIIARPNGSNYRFSLGRDDDWRAPGTPENQSTTPQAQFAAGPAADLRESTTPNADRRRATAAQALTVAVSVSA